MLTAIPITYGRQRTVRILVARTGAVFQLTHGVILAGAVHFIVLALFVVVGMASGAVRPVAAVGPRYGLGIALVATDTPDGRVVVSGVVARGVVITERREPAGSAMALITLDCCYKMARSLPRSRRAVMTGTAVAGDPAMINGRVQPVAAGRMAIITGIAARNVGRTLARCRRAIMAGVAGTRHR